MLILRSSRQIVPLYQAEFGKGEIVHTPVNARPEFAYIHALEIQKQFPEINLDIIIGLVLRGYFRNSDSYIDYVVTELTEMNYSS